jgi:hypothetical protein
MYTHTYRRMYSISKWLPFLIHIEIGVGNLDKGYKT